MKRKNNSWRRKLVASGLLAFFVTLVILNTVPIGTSEAGIFKSWPWRQGCKTHGGGEPGHGVGDLEWTGEPGGTWYWLRSPEEEKRVVIGLYNRYCLRCHGVDGRGVWDIPDVPNFANAAWQASRSDGQLARATLEGRGAVMPPFRGTLTLEEAWAMARYLRTFVPGTELPKGDVGEPEKLPTPKTPAPKN